MMQIDGLNKTEQTPLQKTVYERLGNLMLGHVWEFDESNRRRHLGRGYVRYFRDTFATAPVSVPKIYEEHTALVDRKERVLLAAHRFHIQFMSGEATDQSSADLLTTFGIDVGTGSLVVGQLEGPGQARVNPGVSLYDIYGVDKQPVEEQWEALRTALRA